MENLIITVAPTGNRLRKAKHPLVPISPEEISEDLYECWKAGASVAHVHARDKEENPTSAPDVYEAVWSRLKKARCGIVRQASLAGKATTDQRLLDILDTDAEMASLGMGSINYLDRVNLFEPDFIAELAEKMKNKGIKPELEIFDVSMTDNALRLKDKGLLEEPLKYNFILDGPGTLKGTVDNLLFMVNRLPKEALWGVSAMGPSHVALTAMAVVMGGHVRVGLEDRPFDGGGKPMSNVEQVRWVVGLAEKLGRKVADSDEARRILGLN